MSLDRYGSGAPALADDERYFEAIMRRAKVMARVPGLKPEIIGNAEAVAGIMLSLTGYGLAVTIPGINMAFDWIEGRAEPSALLYQAVARTHGYHIDPRIRTDELAVAHVSGPGLDGGGIEVEFTLAEAKRAHRLDEWIEHWEQGSDKKWHKVGPNLIIAIDGERVAEDPLPDWAEAEIGRRGLKRYEAWWSYRTDMLWKSAAKRAIKIACPHVLLGGNDGEADPAATHPAFGWGRTEAPEQGAPPIETTTTEARSYAEGEEPF